MPADDLMFAELGGRWGLEFRRIVPRVQNNSSVINDYRGAHSSQAQELRSPQTPKDSVVSLNKSSGLMLKLAVMMLLMTSIGRAQSFDCGKAATGIEHAICSDKPLGELDITLANEFKTVMDAAPELHLSLAAGQRRWLAERNQKCGASAGATVVVTSACLASVYRSRISELKTGAAKQAAAIYSTASCQKIADRYRGVAAAHAGESPVAVLTALPNSGITLVPGTDLPNGAADVTEWAKRQTPPFSVPHELAKMADDAEIVRIARLPGQNFYWIGQIDGSAGCYSSQYFTVRKGLAQSAGVPPGFQSGDDMSLCGVRLSFGTLDAVPVFIEDDYDWTPRMLASVTVATWDGDRFTAACNVAFQYAPRFSAHTLTDAAESCNGNACARLRNAAFELVAGVQKNPLQTRARFIQALSGPQREEYEKARQAVNGGDAKDLDSPDTLTEETPLHLPYVLDGHLYVASVGHLTTGDQYYADWRVTFDPPRPAATDTNSASFAVGMVKGAVEKVTVEPVVPAS